MKDKILKMISRATESRPIKRKDLCETLGLNDVQMREYIQQLRENYPICNYQDGRGYFMAKTKAQAQRQYRQEKSRALNILKGLKGLNKVAENKTEFEKALKRLLQGK